MSLTKVTPKEVETKAFVTRTLRTDDRHYHYALSTKGDLAVLNQSGGFGIFDVSTGEKLGLVSTGRAGSCAGTFTNDDKCFLLFHSYTDAFVVNIYEINDRQFKHVGTKTERD